MNRPTDLQFAPEPYERTAGQGNIFSFQALTALLFPVWLCAFVFLRHKTGTIEELGELCHKKIMDKPTFALFGAETLPPHLRTAIGDVLDLPSVNVQLLDSYESIALDDFDGAIVLQGALSSRLYGQDEDFGDLVTIRAKEHMRLVKKGAPTVFLITSTLPIIERPRGIEQSTFVARLIPTNVVGVENFNEAIPFIKTLQQEFEHFYELHGAAHLWFRIAEEAKESIDILATSARGKTAGIRLAKQHAYFIQCILRQETAQFIDLLARLTHAVTLCETRTGTSLPTWSNELRVRDEEALGESLELLLTQKEDLEQKLSKLRSYKSVLGESGVKLQKSVCSVMRDLLGLEVTDDDSYREDIRLHEDGECVALIEVKGENTNFKNAHINQVDDHRESAGLPEDFPKIVVMNSFIKAKSLPDKDIPPVNAQIKHAVKNGVLLVRTLDLIALGNLIYHNRITTAEVLKLFVSSSGWLTVKNGTPIVLTE